MGSINDHREPIEPAFHVNRNRRALEERVVILENKIDLLERVLISVDPVHPGCEAAVRLAVLLAGTARAETERFRRMMQVFSGAIEPGEGK